MSSTPHAPEGPPSDDADGVDIKKILTVGGVSLLVFALSALVAALIMRGEQKQIEARGLPPAPSEIGKDEIGVVDQVEFSQDHRLEEWKAAKRKRLDSYGWVDRTKGLVHIPIDKAMEQVAAQAAGSTPPGAP
jgi:hypothetical protein